MTTVAITLASMTRLRVSLHRACKVTTRCISQEADGAGTESATGEIYCLGHHIYEDSYVPRPGGWRFHEGTVRFHWFEHRPVGGAPAPDPSVPTGRRIEP